MITIAGMSILPTLASAFIRSDAGLHNISISFIMNNSFIVLIAFRYRLISGSDIKQPHKPEIIDTTSSISHIGF